jgi:hypothetical protein
LLVSAEQHAASGDVALQAEVACRYASFLGNTGRLEESLVKIEKAVKLLEQVGALEQLGKFSAGAARCNNARAGRLQRSLQFAEMAREIAASTRNLDVRSWLAMEAEPWFYKGLWHRVVHVVDENLSTAWENGRWNVVLWASGWAAIACLKLNRISDARALLEPAMTTAARRLDFDFCKIYCTLPKEMRQQDYAPRNARWKSQSASLQGWRLALLTAHSARSTRPAAIANRPTGISVEVLTFFRKSSHGPNSPRACLLLANLNSRRTEAKPRDCYTAPLNFSKTSKLTAGSKKPKARFCNDRISLTPTENLPRTHPFQQAPTFYPPATFNVGPWTTVAC